MVDLRLVVGYYHLDQTSWWEAWDLEFVRDLGCSRLIV